MKKSQDNRKIARENTKILLLQSRLWIYTSQKLRLSAIDQVKFEEMIVKLTQKQGFVTRDNVIGLLSINENQAYRLLRKLAVQNKLQLIGKGRNSKYSLI